MSVINQVLNQLERRGIHTSPELTKVRAVPHGRRPPTLPLLIALALALAGGVGAWQWIQIRKDTVVNTVQPPVVRTSIATASSVATVVAQSSVETAVNLTGDTMLADILSPRSSPAGKQATLPAPQPQAMPENASARQTIVPQPPAGLPTPGTKSEQRSAAAPTVIAPPVANPAAPPAPQPQAKQKTAAQHPVTAQPARRSRAPAPSAPEAASGVSLVKQTSPAQLADAEFRKAVALMQQGHIRDAIAGYEETLRLDAGHETARQALVSLLLESKRNADAEHVLQAGLTNKPEHTGFAMLLARLQVARGAADEALGTLRQTSRYAESQADYQAFYAALLQRQNRHEEAIVSYQSALRLSPGNGLWLMGCGISLQALKRDAEARDAYRQALDSRALNPDLEAFVQQRLKEL